MKLIRNLNNIKINEKLALTIGNFDGIHLGHIEIINQVKNIAKSNNLKSAILSFYPHPVNYFKAETKEGFLINSLSHKLDIFKKLEVDYAIILPFNKDLANIEARNFVTEILIKKLNVKDLTIGYDFTFGKNRKGNFKMLENYQNNFSLNEVFPVKNNLQTCSSSFVRKLIRDGKILEANKILNRNFKISGIVNHGKKLGNQIGFPTVNLPKKPHLTQPKFGVYKTRIFIHKENKYYDSITNFGIKPTVTNEKIATFETHIFNFNKDIYSQKVTLEFIDFIREERKFNSIIELKKQIEIDVKNCK